MARVLVVGNHLDARCDLVASIRAAGHAVTLVDSVTSAMTHMSAHETDMLLLNTTLVNGSHLRSALQSVGTAAILPASPYDCFVAIDPVTTRLGATLDQVAAVDSPILITGETGTGKEAAARRIHRSSARARNLFLPVNCGTLSEALIDSELFGHRRGAFTGAVADSQGIIEAAAGGMLFLDEVGELPLSLQAHLLRFLDTREVRRIGESKIRHVDVRVIAATNRDLRAEIRSGRFRSDLFYRLNVLSVRVPPLRDRPADIPDLARLSLQRIAARLARPEVELSPSAVAVLQNYRWPGNVRELQNVMEQAFANATSTVIDELDLPSFDCWDDDETEARPSCGEVENIASVLVRYGGHQTLAARALGISRTTLWRRRKQATAGAIVRSLDRVESI